MNEMTIQETTVQGSAMATYLFSQLTQAIQQVAQLSGEKAILEYRLAQLSAEVEALKPATTPEVS